MRISRNDLMLSFKKVNTANHKKILLGKILILIFGTSQGERVLCASSRTNI